MKADGLSSSCSTRINQSINTIQVCRNAKRIPYIIIFLLVSNIIFEINYQVSTIINDAKQQVATGSDQKVVLYSTTVEDCSITNQRRNHDASPLGIDLVL